MWLLDFLFYFVGDGVSVFSGLNHVMLFCDYINDTVCSEMCWDEDNASTGMDKSSASLPASV